MNYLNHLLKLSSIVFSLSLTLPLSAFADELSDAKSQLTREIKLLDNLRLHVKKQDLGRLIVLRNACDGVLHSLQTVGIKNFKTVQQYQNLVMTFRFSDDFFKKVDPEIARPLIKELKSINEEIASTMGFDDSPFTQMTANIFTHMHKIILSLMAMDLDPEVKARLQSLIPALGNAISIALGGDQLESTIIAGKNVYQKIVEIYPLLDRITLSQPAVEAALTMRDLNEIYASYVLPH